MLDNNKLIEQSYSEGESFKLIVDKQLITLVCRQGLYFIPADFFVCLGVVIILWHVEPVSSLLLWFFLISFVGILPRLAMAYF